jgi:hypothetical protein
MWQKSIDTRPADIEDIARRLAYLEVCLDDLSKRMTGKTMIETLVEDLYYGER